MYTVSINARHWGTGPRIGVLWTQNPAVFRQPYVPQSLYPRMGEGENNNAVTVLTTCSKKLKQYLSMKLVSQGQYHHFVYCIFISILLTCGSSAISPPISITQLLHNLWGKHLCRKMINCLCSIGPTYSTLAQQLWYTRMPAILWLPQPGHSF